jgi:hypothetical protein
MPARSAALALIALAATGAGVSIAAIPAPDGTISACYDKKGDLRLIDAGKGKGCKKGTGKLTWNARGAKGDKGAKGDPCLPSNRACVGPVGPPGPKGDPGAAGLLYQVYQGPPIGIFNGEEIVSMRVPPGTYQVTAYVMMDVVHRDATFIEAPTCTVGTDEPGHNLTRNAFEGREGTSQTWTYMLGIVVTAADPILRLRCRTSDVDGFWEEGQLSALPVAGLA